MNTRNNKQLLVPGRIESKIRFLRGQKVMISPDLAALYNVPVRVLIQAVKRNKARFPPDFMFQLGKRDIKALRSQFVISKHAGRGGTRYFPYAFTEQGIAMLSSVLRSERAVQVNIAIVRAFVHLRALLATHEELRRKIEQLERKYDSRFQAVFAIIKQMLATPIPPKRTIGFHLVTVR
ncbi:MAG: ORF6N domain-containing protein [Candidatus Acidiferrum sp.]